MNKWVGAWMFGVKQGDSDKMFGVSGKHVFGKRGVGDSMFGVSDQMFGVSEQMCCH